MDAKTNSMIIFCFWMLFHVAQAQQETTPTRLTGLGKNCSTIPVALLDQCFPYEESKTFGIEFRLPQTGGSCDDGLIICYLGSLATRTLDNVHSMNGLSVNSELFNVDNAVNNSLAKYCAGLNVSWHGIKVHTEKSNGKNIMKLSTSLLEDEEQSFEIPDAQRQFNIHFGNENEFSSYVTVEGQRIDLDVEKVEQYKQLAPKGAHLKDFVGFWTLGLDMLPWMDHEVKLFVNRSCSCSMEAWFIRPTDGVPKDPKEPSTGIGGPNAKCIANTIKKVSLKNSLKANRLIRIQMLIDGNAVNDSISIELLDLSKTALMTFIISSGQNATIEMNGLSKMEMVNVYLPKGNGTRHADFIIALTEYSYGFVMNKSLLGSKEFFPANWWKGLQFNDMKAFRLRGQFLLLADPLVMPFEAFGQQNYKPQELKLPYWERISIVQPDTKVTFRVKLHSIGNDFNISFFHNRIESPKSGDLIGAKIGTFNVRPMDNKIIMSSYKSPSDGKIDLNKFSEKFEAQKAYEFNFTVHPKKLQIKLNDYFFLDFPTQLPVWAANFIAVEGHVTLLATPNVIAPPKNRSTDTLSSDFAIKLNTLLDYNDKIQLKMTSGNRNFSILLLHDALKWDDNIGFVVLEMIFSFEGDNCHLTCQYFRSENSTKEHKNDIGSVDGRLNKYGQEFYMDITAAKNNFAIEIEEVELTHLCPYPKSKGSADYYPPSAVDYIRFQGNVHVHAMNITHPPASEQRKFMQINGTKDLVQAGDLITVKLAIKALKASPSVTINLFHEALQFHEIVGKTVLKVMLNSTALCFSSSKLLNKDSTNNEKCTKGKLDKELKELQIRVMDDGFNVTLTWNNDSSKTYTYIDGLPEWAVQYITVEYNNVTLSNPPIITCVPEERCMRPNSRTEQYNIKKDSIQI